MFHWQQKPDPANVKQVLVESIFFLYSRSPVYMSNGVGYGSTLSIPLPWLSLLLLAYPSCLACWFLRGPRRRLSRHRHGLYAACGYNLTGLREARCPECGQPMEQTTMPRRTTGP